MHGTARAARVVPPGPESGIAEAERFERSVRAHAGPMWALARCLTGEPALARTVLEEAFRRADTDPGKLRLAVIRGALGALARRRPGPALDVDRLLPRYHPDGSLAEAPRPWAAERLAQAGLRARLRGWIARLPDPCRGAVLLCDVAGLSRETAAEALGLAVADVGPALHRGRLALRGLIDAYLRDGQGVP